MAKTASATEWGLIDQGDVPVMVKPGGRTHVETAEDRLIGALLASPGKAARIAVSAVPDLGKGVRAIRQAANRQDRTAVVVNDGTTLFVTLIDRVIRPRKTDKAS